MKNTLYIILIVLLFGCGKDDKLCLNTVIVINDSVSTLCQVHSEVHSYLNPEDQKVRNWAILYDLNSNSELYVRNEDDQIVDGLSDEYIRINIIFEEGRLWNVILGPSLFYDCEIIEKRHLEAVSIIEYTENGLVGNGTIDLELSCGLSVKGEFSVK